MAEELEVPVEGQPNESPVENPVEQLEEGIKPEVVDKAEYEALRKEMDKLSQERNMLRNRTKALEGKVLETDDLAAIKEAYAELAKEKQEREEAEAREAERKEAESFRDKVIAEYPKEVQEAAKKLIEKNKNNLIWENATSWEDARRQLVPQLEALKEVVSIKTEEDGTVIHPNNPGMVDDGTKKFEDLTIEEMRKVLPRAESR